MELNENIQNKIDQYVRGDMSESETSRFEQEIKQDSDLQEAVAVARFEMDAMEYLLEEDLRREAADWENNPSPEENQNDPSGNNYLQWGFGFVLVLVLAGLAYFHLNQESSPTDAPTQQQEPPPPNEPIAEEDDLPGQQEILPEDETIDAIPNPNTDQEEKPADTNYEELANYIKNEAYQLPGYLSNLKSFGADGPDNALSRGIKAFGSGAYQSAIRELEGIDPSSDLYASVSSILPHAYFKGGEYEKAARQFKEKMDADPQFQDEPQWYYLLSLAMDYSKNKETVDILLRQITEDNLHGFNKQALALKAEIKKIK